MNDLMSTSSNLSARYTLTAIILHWLIAALIIGGFGLGWIMTDIPGFTPTKLRYYAWHKWIGITVFALAWLRVLWRLTHATVAPPAAMPAWQRLMSNAVHGALYVLMIAIPAFGYLYSSAAGVQVVYLGWLLLPTLIEPNPWLKPIFLSMHIWLNYALLGLFVLHLLGVIKHTLIDRDGLLWRMIPFRK
jgi:cytochrome b561